MCSFFSISSILVHFRAARFWCYGMNPHLCEVGLLDLVIVRLSGRVIEGWVACEVYKCLGSGRHASDIPFVPIPVITGQECSAEDPHKTTSDASIVTAKTTYV